MVAVRRHIRILPGGLELEQLGLELFWDTWQPNYYPKGEGKKGKGKGKGKGKEKSKSRNEKGKRKQKIAPWRKDPEYKGTTQVTQSTRYQGTDHGESGETHRPTRKQGTRACNLASF